MSAENYLNHTTFGLLFRVCLVDDKRELFTTLYAQRLFFIVTQSDAGLEFEAITRSDARVLIENRVRSLRRMGPQAEYERLLAMYKQTFQ